MTQADTQEIASDLKHRFETWLDAHAPLQQVLVAVSGGSDSMALLTLATGSARLKSRVAAATVDHGLRPGSAAEAQVVASTCEALGAPHEILVWSGEKPAAGLQAAARCARYHLLARHAETIGADAIMVGHTSDDVAETFLMRLSRGAGLSGLAAIQQVSFIAAGAGRPVALWRPLLHETRASLRSYLSAARRQFIDDPSNDDPTFERARLRAALRACAGEVGLSPSTVALSAARLRDAADRAFTDENARFEAAGGLFDRHGAAQFDAEAAGRVAAAGALAGRIIQAVSGAMYSPSDSAASDAILHAAAAGKASIGGALIERWRDKIFVYREPAALHGREGVEPLSPLIATQPGDILWDNRFILTLSQPATIRRSGAAQAAFLGPARIVDGLPSVEPDRALAAIRPLASERFFGRVKRF